jgi:hypothetical protein
VTAAGVASRVTVVSAVHRPGAHLPAFLARLDRCLAEGAQVVVVDDASADGTGEALVAWAASRPAAVVVVADENAGVARSRNRALRHATGDFVWFVDHDDEWEDDALAVLTAAAGPERDDSVDVVWCRADHRRRAGEPGKVVDGLDEHRTVPGDVALALLLERQVDGFLWSKLLRRRLLGDAPFPELTSQSDVAGVAAVLARASHVRFVPELLYHWTHREGSITRVSTPRLANLERAHDLVVAAARGRGGAAADERALQRFTTTFLCLALVALPVRLGASAAVRQDGLTRARRALRGVDLGAVRRRDPLAWGVLRGAVVAPRATARVLRGLYAAHDARVRTRAGLRALARPGAGRALRASDPVHPG